MSDKEVLDILRKYERVSSFSSKNTTGERADHRNNLTERKFEAENYNLITFMNDSATPIKQYKESEASQKFLRKLDQTEQKLALSERKYVQLWRKYQSLKDQAQELERRFINQQQVHNDELVNLNNKLVRLERDNQIHAEKLHAKDNLIEILEQKINRKNQQILKVEQEFQSKPNSSRHNFTDSNDLLSQREISRYKDDSQKSMEILLENYKRKISDLNQHLKRFDNVLYDKQRQKQQLASEMEEMYIKHSRQISQLKKCLKAKDEQVQSIVQKSKEERINHIEHYEKLVRETKKTVLTQKEQILHRETNQMMRLKQNIGEFELKITLLQDQNQQYSQNLEKHQRMLVQNEQHTRQLVQENEKLRQSLTFIEQSKNELARQNKQLEGKLSWEKKQRSETLTQHSQFKSKCHKLLMETNSVQKENQTLRTQIQKLKNIILALQNELEQVKNSELNLNGKLTSNATQMKQKVRDLEGQLDETTQQLYAQRLEKARAIEQLQQTKSELKKEYSLSLENLQREMRMKENMNFEKYDSDYQTYDKESLYLKLKQLERKYQTLTSQVISVQDLMSIATKVHKRYKV